MTERHDSSNDTGQTCAHARVVQFIPEGTFPIYLLHFPLLVLLASTVPYDRASAPQKCLLSSSLPPLVCFQPIANL
jgi:peptidoglycan/LPS O-acetylase OafA/YrhL